MSGWLLTPTHVHFNVFIYSAEMPNIYLSLTFVPTSKMNHSNS